MDPVDPDPDSDPDPQHCFIVVVGIGSYLPESLTANTAVMATPFSYYVCLAGRGFACISRRDGYGEEGEQILTKAKCGLLFILS